MYEGHFPVGGQEEMLRPLPVTFFDAKQRGIEIHVYGDGPIESEFEALVDMYRTFDPSFRTLGIPPIGERRIREWLDEILGDYCTLAWHGERVIGHAVLVNAGSDGYELAIFLHQDYHGTGIGTQLLEGLLTYGREHGVKRVWLLVERDNRPAVNLYNDVGFVVTNEFDSDIEMALAM